MNGVTDKDLKPQEGAAQSPEQQQPPVVSSDPTEGNREASAHTLETYLRPFITEVYKDSGHEPSDALKEIHGGSADINSGFGGDFVYLRKGHTTSELREALTGFHFNLTDYRDMPKGQGGGWPYYSGDLASGTDPYTSRWCRWLQYVMGGNHGNDVRDAALYRMPKGSGGSKGQPPDGWKWIGYDLNYKRDKDFLYIVTR